jgi:hypothetical protein
LSVALLLNTHYYAILFLIPLCAAELFRTIEHRRLDRPMLAAIGAGMAGMVFILPFLKAASEFVPRINNAGLVSRFLILGAYRSFLVDDGLVSSMRHGARLAPMVFMVLVVWAFIRQLRSQPWLLPKAEAVFLILLAAQPLFGYLLGRFATHTMEARHLMPALVGIAPLLAIALLPLLRRKRSGQIALIVLFAATAIAGSLRIHAARTDMRETIGSLTLTPETKALLTASQSKALYFQECGWFALANYYEPDPWIRSRVTLVYSMEQELRWNHMDTVSRTAQHLQNFTALNLVTYESLATQPGDHIFMDDVHPWNWIDRALANSHASVRPVGPAISGDPEDQAISVRFRR